MDNRLRHTNTRLDPNSIVLTFRCEKCEVKHTKSLAKIQQKIAKGETVKCFCYGTLKPLNVFILPFELDQAVERMEKKKEYYENILHERETNRERDPFPS